MNSQETTPSARHGQQPTEPIITFARADGFGDTGGASSKIRISKIETCLPAGGFCASIFGFAGQDAHGV
jgi:hypothetical protein